MNTEKFTIRVAVWLILEQDGKVLLMRRYNTGYKDGEYTAPAGHVEEDEGATAAMIREAKEETNIVLYQEHLTVGHITHRKCPDREYIDMFFVASNWEGTPENMELNKCDDMEWFDVDNLPDNTLDNVVFALKSVKDNMHYGELGWE